MMIFHSHVSHVSLPGKNHGLGIPQFKNPPCWKHKNQQARDRGQETPKTEKEPKESEAVKDRGLDETHGIDLGYDS